MMLSLSSHGKRHTEVKTKFRIGSDVFKFLNAFTRELLGLPPCQEIKFEIDLVPNTKLISIPPYIMASSKLKDYDYNYKTF